MGLHDRDYGRPGPYEGGFKRAVRRVLGQGGSFLDWAVPLFTIRGIRVRMHLFFVVYIAIELIGSLDGSKDGFIFAALRIGALFGLVLIHEFGHCIACRRVGGEAFDIVMWPLGGLAMVNPPHNPRAALITTIGGPLVHILLAPVIAGLLLATGVGADVLLFNPLSPSVSLGALAAHSNAVYYLRVGLFMAWIMNFYLFCFNVLLPMFPMDAGRMLQEALWFRMGYRRSMQYAVNTGLAIAVLVGIYAMTIGRNQQNLLGIAILCGFYCWMERTRLGVMEPEGYTGYDYASTARDKRKKAAPSKADIKRREEEAALNAEVDRILEKIRTEGMGSLTKKEKATLKGETERKRRQAAER